MKAKKLIQSLVSALRKRNKENIKTMIEEFIDSALIIDDVEKDVEGLKRFLESKDIWAKYYSPDELKGHGKLKNRKIIFLDLYISKTAGAEPKGHISEIRKLFETVIGIDFGTYGIVLWSAHIEEINELKEKIKVDGNEYTLPIFIVGLDKKKYLKNGNYDSLFADLDEQIKENIAAYFFIQWEILVRKGKDYAINNIFSLVKDYNKQDQDLKYILLKLAQNYIGIPIDNINDYKLHLDAFKVFNDMMYYEISNMPSEDNNIFKNPDQIKFSGTPEEMNEIFSLINYKQLFDSVNISQNIIIPGNVYEIITESSLFKVDDAPINSKLILIEVSPPCDFSNKKTKMHKVIGGFISEYSKEGKDKYNKKEYCYKEIWPVNIEGNKFLIFDFRFFGSLPAGELLDSSKYKIKFRVKNNLFADILQKLSSHTARLGLSIIHPQK